MATTITKIVDPDNGAGTDYTSLLAWEAGEQKDLVAANEIAVAECRCTGGSADGNVQTHGWTADIDHYIKIWTEPNGGYRHLGKWDETKYRVVSSGCTLNSYTWYTKIMGLQIELTAAFADGVVFVKESYGEFAYNILRYTGGGTSGVGFLINAPAEDTKLWNNIIYNFSDGIFHKYNASYQYRESYVYNTTIYNCSRGYRVGTTYTMAVKNCIAQSCSIGFSEDAGAFSGNNNISNDATAPGVDSKINTTVQFVDIANNDFHLSGFDEVAMNAGCDLSSIFTDDIDGDSRPMDEFWDIGADESMQTISFVPRITIF